MVAINKKNPQDQPDANVPDAIPGIHLAAADEARADFERLVQETLGISGEEFLRRWDAGTYRPTPDTPEGWKVGRLVMLFPLVGRSVS